jgi:hydrogenase expression/formation protein HypD
VTLVTYGDLVRVPGEGGSLERARGEGADVRVVTSAMEAVEIAACEPDREVVFAAVGFETTAPGTAAALLRARADRVPNLSVLACHKLVVPAMRALLEDPGIRIDGFLCPGHVSVVIGADAYVPLVREHGRPCVVCGFDAVQILEGIVELVRQIASGEGEVANLYPQVVRSEGNPRALELLHRVFRPGDAVWRALGTIPASGLDLRPEFEDHDAYLRFDVTPGEDRDPPGCRCGEVITGRTTPPECELFGLGCTPRSPVGPCMVGSEGTCRAWFKYGRRKAG